MYMYSVCVCVCVCMCVCACVCVCVCACVSCVCDFLTAVHIKLNIYLFVCLTVPSGSVTNLNARDVLPTSVELSWGPVNARDQNGIILSYNIYYRLHESNPYSSQLNVTERVSENSSMYQGIGSYLHTYVAST